MQNTFLVSDTVKLETLVIGKSADPILRTFGGRTRTFVGDEVERLDIEIFPKFSQKVVQIKEDTVPGSATLRKTGLAKYRKLDTNKANDRRKVEYKFEDIQGTLF